MIPFNLRGLIDAMGGPNARGGPARRVLQATGWQLGALRAGGLHAELSNEPSIATPWVYLYTGQPHKAQEIVRIVQNTLWKDTPDGIPGNDDLGAMSSWYVWTALGLYPGIPGRAELWVTTPLFPRAVIRRANGKAITIEAPEASSANAFVQDVTIDGKPSSRAWLPEGFARDGGTLRFTVAATPNQAWGAGRTKPRHPSTASAP